MKRTEYEKMQSLMAKLNNEITRKKKEQKERKDTNTDSEEDDDEGLI